MRTLSLTVLSLLLGLGLTAAEPIDDALKPFQGTWAVVSITRDGQEVPADQAQRLVLVVKGHERIVMDGDDIKSQATFTVDPTKTPKTMDLTVAEGPLAGKTLKGIYEIEGDTLRINLLLVGEGRPTDMTATKGSQRLLQVFERSSAGSKADPVKIKNPELRTLLLARMKADQGGRQRLVALLKKHAGKLTEEAKAEFEAIAAEQQDTDFKNREWLGGVIEKHGWPGIAAVGKDGSQAAFLIAQHADGDRKFQKKCLELLAASVKAKDALPENLAYLTDRVRVASGDKQVYGTELQHTEGKIVPHPIEDEAEVDTRRKAVGLPPLDDALKQARKDHGIPD